MVMVNKVRLTEEEVESIIDDGCTFDMNDIKYADDKDYNDTYFQIECVTEIIESLQFKADELDCNRRFSKEILEKLRYVIALEIKSLDDDVNKELKELKEAAINREEQIKLEKKSE